MAKATCCKPYLQVCIQAHRCQSLPRDPKSHSQIRSAMALLTGCWYFCASWSQLDSIHQFQPWSKLVSSRSILVEEYCAFGWQMPPLALQIGLHALSGISPPKQARTCIFHHISSRWKALVFRFSQWPSRDIPCFTKKYKYEYSVGVVNSYWDDKSWRFSTNTCAWHSLHRVDKIRRARLPRRPRNLDTKLSRLTTQLPWHKAFCLGDLILALRDLFELSWSPLLTDAFSWLVNFSKLLIHTLMHLDLPH